MPQSWQDDLRTLREHFRNTLPPSSNLWHAVAWSFDAQWNAEAEMVDWHSVLCRSNGRVEYGRYLGGDDGLRRFRSLADAAFRCLLRATEHEAITQPVRLPYSPRDYSPCWLGVLYSLAWEDDGGLLRAPERYIRTLDEETGDGWAHYKAKLNFDVFAASAVAIAHTLSGRIG